MQSKKEASAKQEKLVADFMDWKVVTGSGARPFRPGDVGNDKFLVECKTHVDEQNNIIFYTKHWNKICIESQSTNRYPVLVTDNGTQKSSNTWVMMPRRIIPQENEFRIFGLENKAKSTNAITFINGLASKLFKLGKQENHINFFPEWCNGEQVAIMPLSEFKEFYRQEFES